MAEFPFVLGKVNLAMCAAILVVYLLRRPIRSAFHAQIAYGLWLLVPAVALASMLPPRVVAIRSVDVINFPIGAGTMQPMLTVPHEVSPDWTLLIFAVWLAGTCAVALYLVRLQYKFHIAERAGAAGPAVVGFFRPRIVIPTVFEAQFNASERAAILAHERAHLVRQDARVNAIAALLRCLCWFNPLIHLASVWLRRDQEMACDAAALRDVPRLEYANTLLKAQMPVASLPLGCAWPGSEHPLTERVALLKRPVPETVRRRAGIFAIVAMMLSGGLSAWAAQPPTVSAPAADQPANGSTMRPAPPSTSISPGMIIVHTGKSGLHYFLTLDADKEQNNTDGSVKLSGHVVMHFPTGFVTADSATVNSGPNKQGQTIKFAGNWELDHGIGNMRGKTLTYDLQTGMLDLDGKKMPSGMPKMVPCTQHCNRF